MSYTIYICQVSLSFFAQTCRVCEFYSIPICHLHNISLLSAKERASRFGKYFSCSMGYFLQQDCRISSFASLSGIFLGHVVAAFASSLCKKRTESLILFHVSKGQWLVQYRWEMTELDTELSLNRLSQWTRIAWLEEKTFKNIKC